MSSSLAAGRKLLDRYLLEQQIGAGGMAEVWRARDLVLDRAVAVKVLSGATAQVADDSGLRIDTRQEARAAAGLAAHPNITAVYDFGTATRDDGQVLPFLVMELLHGELLSDLMSRGPVPWPQTARIGAQIASALAAAHAQHVVHRDIKPGNVMLTPAGVKVLDFGIAATSGRPDPTGGWLFGTPAYAAPERLRQSLPDPAADVYALGVLLFEMLTGRLPVPVHTWPDAQAAHAQPRAIPDIPPALGAPTGFTAMVRACLDHTPAHRPDSAALSRALQRFAPGAATTAVTAPTAVQPVATPTPTRAMQLGGPVSAAAAVPARTPQAVRQPTTAQPPGRPPARRRSRLGPALLTTIALVLLAGGGLAASGWPFSGSADPSGGATQGPAIASPAGAPPKKSATPSPDPSTATALSMLRQLEQTISTGVQNGDLDAIQALDLANRLREIAGKWQDERWKDVVRRTEDLQEKIDNWVEDDHVTEDLGGELDELLDQVKSAAREKQED